MTQRHRLLLLLMTGLPANAVAQAARPAACGALTPYGIEPVRGAGARYPGRFPSLAAMGPSWVVAADSVERFDQRLSTIRVSVQSADGKRAQSPPERAALYPVVARPGAIAEVLWGESGPTADGWHWPPEIQGIVAARYAKGVLSAPRVVYTARRLRWNPQSRSGVVAGRDDKLLVAFSATTDRGERMVLLRATKGVWRSQEVEVPIGVAYLSIASIGDTVVAGLIGGGQISSGDRTGAYTNAVWVMWSTDFGRSWSTPRFVHGAPGRESHHLTLAADGRRVHMVWSDARAGESGRALSHVTIQPGTGATSPVTSLPIPGTVGTIGSALTACGLLVMWTDGGLPEPGLASALWRDQWLSRGRAWTSYLVTGLDLKPDGAGGALVALSGSLAALTAESPANLWVGRFVAERRGGKQRGR